MQHPDVFQDNQMGLLETDCITACMLNLQFYAMLLNESDAGLEFLFITNNTYTITYQQMMHKILKAKLTYH